MTCVFFHVTCVVICGFCLLPAGCWPQDATSVTTFHGCLAVLEQMKPRWGLLENVEGIDDASDDASPTNLDLVTKELQNVGYVVGTALLVASSYGVPQRRKRLYIFCVRADAPDMELPAAQALQDALRMVQLLQIPAEPAALASIIRCSRTRC